MSRLIKITALLFCSLLLTNRSSVAQETTVPILFIYDASGSMWGKMDGVTKKVIGGRVLIETVNALPDSQPVGLMVYGHRKEKDCDDIEMMTGLENRSKDIITKAINGITPLGRTPLARSATLAIAAVKEAGKD